jgi:hypothetical protein
MTEPAPTPELSPEQIFDMIERQRETPDFADRYLKLVQAEIELLTIYGDCMGEAAQQSWLATARERMAAMMEFKAHALTITTKYDSHVDEMNEQDRRRAELN